MLVYGGLGIPGYPYLEDPMPTKVSIFYDKVRIELESH